MKQKQPKRKKEIRYAMPKIDSNILAGVLLFGLSLLFFHKLVSLKFLTIGHVEDHLRIFYPYRAFDAEMLKSFTIPLWNPYTFGGFPYLASLRCHLFYPLNLMFLILPTYLGMNMNYILQIFLAGLFMHWLGKTLGMDTYSSLVSALSFMFSSFLIDKVSWGHLTMLGSACWLPLILLLFIKAVENKKMLYAVIGGLIVAVQLFSGHPQLPYYGLLALFFLALFEFIRNLSKKESFIIAFTPFLYFLIMVFVGIGLSAIQLIPANEIAQYSIRSSIIDRFAFFTRWSMEFFYPVTFILPRLSPTIGTNSFPFPIALGYIGILPLLLAITSIWKIKKNRYVLFFVLVSLFAIIFALGRYTPVYYFFYQYFPGFKSFRNPIFFLYLYVFSMCILSGLGMSHLQKSICNIYSKNFKIFIITIFTICFLLTFIASITYFLPLIKNKGAMITQYLPVFFDTLLLKFLKSLLIKIQKLRISLIYDFVIMAFILGIATLTIFLWNRLEKYIYLSRIIIISLIFLELFLYGRHFIQVYDLNPFISGGKWVDYLKKDKQLYRVLPILPYPEQDAVLKVNKIPSINGYGSLEIMQNYVDFIEAFQDQPVVQDTVIMRVTNYNSQAVNLLNTKYVLIDKPIKNGQFQLVFTDQIPMAQTWNPFNKNYQKMYIYKNREALPRAFLVDSLKIIKEKEEILKALSNPSFDPCQTIILEKDPDMHLFYPANSRTKGEVEFVNYSENEFIIKASASRNCFLFLSEIYYPGWKVFIDDEEKEIFRANYLFRAIYLEKGSHLIKFIFDPTSYKTGKVVTLFTAFLLILYFSFQLFKKYVNTNLDDLVKSQKTEKSYL